MKLLSDQVSQREIDIILRECGRALQRHPRGDVVEFGCYVGTTSVFLAELLSNTHRTLWLYDSFAGLPEKSPQDSSPAGEQFKAGELLASRKELERNLRPYRTTHIRVKKSWFSELEDRDIPEHIAFAFLDGDYYMSINDSLQKIWDKLVPGAIVVVDDYANEALPGAARAVDEWAKKYHFSVRTEQSLALFEKPSN